MTDEAEDSGCKSQDPDDAVVSTGAGGGGNSGGNNHNGSNVALTAATVVVSSPNKKSKPSSADSSEVPGTPKSRKVRSKLAGPNGTGGNFRKIFFGGGGQC